MSTSIGSQPIWFVFLLLWGLWIANVQKRPFLPVPFSHINWLPTRFASITLTLLFSQTAVPHPTYPFTCCLLN